MSCFVKKDNETFFYLLNNGRIYDNREFKGTEQTI